MAAGGRMDMVQVLSKGSGMSDRLTIDPMERLVEDALSSAGLSFVREGSPQNPFVLDFYLPDHGVAIEVKQFHSDRIAAQMARAPNVIALQGEAAVRFFCERLRAGAGPTP
jgi:hypothetical protein